MIEIAVGACCDNRYRNGEATQALVLEAAASLAGSTACITYASARSVCSGSWVIIVTSLWI